VIKRDLFCLNAALTPSPIWAFLVRVVEKVLFWLAKFCAALGWIMKNKIVAGGLLLVVICIALYGLEIGRYVDGQTDLFLGLNALFAYLPAGFWQNVTFLGDALILLSLLSFLAFRLPQAWAGLFGSIPLLVLLSSQGKTYFAMPRPAAVLGHDRFTIVGEVLTGSNSLPSGHTMTVFAIATVVLFFILTQKKSSLYLYMTLLVMVLTGLSRVAVGAHWPLDVVLGAILGGVAGLSGVFLVLRYQAWWAWIKQPRYRYALLAKILLFPLATAVLLFEQIYPSIPMVWLSLLVGVLVPLYFVFVVRVER